MKKFLDEIKLNRVINNILYKTHYDEDFLPNYRYLIYSNEYEPLVEIDINKRELIIENSVFKDIMNIEYDRNIHNQVLNFLKKYHDFNILVYLSTTDYNGTLVSFDEYEKDLEEYERNNTRN